MPSNVEPPTDAQRHLRQSAPIEIQLTRFTS